MKEEKDRLKHNYYMAYYSLIFAVFMLIVDHCLTDEREEKPLKLVLKVGTPDPRNDSYEADTPEPRKHKHKKKKKHKDKKYDQEQPPERKQVRT